LFVHEEDPPVGRRHSESLGRLPESRMESYGLPPTAAEQPSQTVQRSVILSGRPVSRGIPRLACAAEVKYLVLAIKPQVYPEILKTLSGKIRRDQIVISIAPSYSIAQVKEGLGGEVRVVRAMPNTPAMVGEGMSGVCFSGDIYSDEEKQMVQTFFSSFGKMEIVPEHLINAVTVASGSSPAFVYMFIEALADSAVKYGMPRNQAYTFAAQAVLGSAKMVLETGEHPGRLKDNVCSPGGTTIEGVAVLEAKGMRSAVIEAASAVFDKCNRM